GEETVEIPCAGADNGELGGRRRADLMWLFVAALALAALVLWDVILRGMDRAPVVETWVPWWALALVFYLAEAYVVPLRLRRGKHAISLSDTGVVLGLYLLTPVGLLGAAIVGAAAGLVLVRRQRPTELAFNLAQLAITTAVALVVFRSVAAL